MLLFPLKGLLEGECPPEDGNNEHGGATGNSQHVITTRATKETGYPGEQKLAFGRREYLGMPGNEVGSTAALT